MDALQSEKPIIKNGDLSSDTNGLKVGIQFESEVRIRDVVAEKQGVSCSEIQRYIRLTNLLPELLDLLDQDKVPVMAGYELSFLDAAAQEEISRFFQLLSQKFKFTLKHAEVIRAAFEKGNPVNVDTIPGILNKSIKKPGPVTYKFSLKELKKQYAIPDGFDLTEFIHEILAQNFSKT